MVSCSELPNPELTISELTGRAVKVIAKAKDEFADSCQCGYTCLAQNPLVGEKFAASSAVIEEADKGISLWDVNPDSWTADSVDFSVATSGAAGAKRQRTEIARIAPVGHIKC